MGLRIAIVKLVVNRRQLVKSHIGQGAKTRFPAQRARAPLGSIRRLHVTRAAGHATVAIVAGLGPVVPF